MKSRAQASTEYLVILAIVIIIALVAANALGKFPSLGAGTSSRVSSSYWRTADLAVVAYRVDTNGSAEVVVKNNMPGSVRLVGFELGGVELVSAPVSLRPGQSATLSGSVGPGSDGYAFNVTASYYDANRMGPFVFSGEEKLVGDYQAIGNVSNTSSDWWDPAWAYRLEIAINNTAGNLTNQPVEVRLNSTNVGPGFDWTQDMNAIRFTNSSGSQLSYWIEDWGAASARVWVKIVSLANNTNATIRMYYGNPSASSASNGTATFEFFDGFDYANISELQSAGWNRSSFANVSLNSGWVKVAVPSPVPVGDDLVGITRATGFAAANLKGRHYETRARNVGNSWGPNTRLGSAGTEGYSDGTYLQMQRTGGYKLNVRYAGVIKGSTVLGADFNNQTIRNRYTVFSDWTHGAYYRNEVTGEEKTAAEATSYSSYTNGNIGLWIHKTSPAFSYVEWDWVFIRKQISPEPALAMGPQQARP